MQVLHSAETIFFCLTLLLAAICCHGKNEMLKVVGFMKHPDIVEGRIKTSQTFSGIIHFSFIYVLVVCLKYGDTDKIWACIVQVFVSRLVAGLKMEQLKQWDLVKLPKKKNSEYIFPMRLSGMEESEKSVMHKFTVQQIHHAL